MVSVLKVGSASSGNPLKQKVMKVLLINGSPRKKGNTFLTLSEVATALERNGIETEIFSIGNRPIQGCIACGKCQEARVCVFKDEVYLNLREKLKKADGVVIGSPTYFAGPAGALCALLDRLFYSCYDLVQFKPAAAVVTCRRCGSSATLDRLQKYFSICNMPVVSSQYWNGVHGRTPGEVLQDAEGMQTMRVLGDNMSWILKSLHGKESSIERAPGVYPFCPIIIHYQYIITGVNLLLFYNYF